MKQKTLIRILFIAGILLSGLYSCTYETIIPKDPEVPEDVSFELNVIPIFNSSCNSSGCHNKGGIRPDLSADNAYTSLTFFGYVDTDNPESSVIYTKINTGSIKNYATAQDRAIILKWIEQGALDN